VSRILQTLLQVDYARHFMLYSFLHASCVSIEDVEDNLLS
jgi:hypothetical protein